MGDPGTWFWIVIGIILLMVLSAVLPILRRFVFAFTVAFVVLLAIHFKENPQEAMTAYAGLGAAFVARRPLLRVIGL